MPEGSDDQTAGPMVSAPGLASPDRVRRILQVGQGNEHRLVVRRDDLFGRGSVAESPETRHGFRSGEREVEAGVPPVAERRLAGERVEPVEDRPEILGRHIAVQAEERAPPPETADGHLAGGDVVVVPVVGDGLDVVDRRVGVGSEPRNADHNAVGRSAGRISRDWSPGSSRDTSGTAVPLRDGRPGRGHRRPGHGAGTFRCTCVESGWVRVGSGIELKFSARLTG